MGDILAKIDPLTLRTVVGVIGGFFICLLIFGRSSQRDPNGKTPGKPLIESFGDFAAYLGLLLGAAFWCIYWFGIFHPERVGGWMSVGMTVLSLLFGIAQPIALPWLIAKTFPRETFALHVHKKTIDTDAFKIMLATTTVMSVVSFLMAWGWLGTIGINNPVDRTFIAVMLVALATMVPSFAMLAIIPKHWKLQLEIEEILEKKERLAHAEEMLIEAHLLQAIIEMSLDPLQMAADQRTASGRKVAEILGSVIVRVNEGTRAMVRIAALMTRNQSLRISTPEDSEIYEKLYELFEIQQDKVMYQIEDRQPTVDLYEDVTPRPEDRRADVALRQYEEARADVEQAERRYEIRRSRTRAR